jgi:hypothetical protein
MSGAGCGKNFEDLNMTPERQGTVALNYHRIEPVRKRFHRARWRPGLAVKMLLLLATVMAATFLAFALWEESRREVPREPVMGTLG